MTEPSEASPQIRSAEPREGSTVDHLPRMRRASVWAVAGYAASQAIRLVGNLVLWRVLYPQAFGIMAIVNVVVQGLQMFSDIGIGPSIVQSPRGDDADYLNTAWTIQVVRGFALFVAAAASAGLVARFYGTPELGSLIPVVALTTVIQGFNSTRVFSARRQVTLGRATVIDLISQSIALLAMVVLAWLTRSVWALAFGVLFGSTAQMLLSHTALPGRPNRFRWDPSSARALVRFGRWIFLSTLLTFAVLNSDRLIFGKLISLEMLGVYSIATVWAMLPRIVLAHLCSSVIFPVLSSEHNAGRSLIATFGRIRLTWLFIGAWIVACLISGGDTLIRFLYDERARDAGWVIQLLAMAAWLGCVNDINQTAIIAQGHPKWLVASNLAKLVGMAVLIPLGFSFWGFRGAVAALVAIEGFAYLTTAYGLFTTGIVPLAVDVTISSAVALTAGLGILTRDVTRQVVASGVAHERLAAFIEGFVTLLALSATWWIVWRVSRSVGWLSLTRPAGPSP